MEYVLEFLAQYNDSQVFAAYLLLLFLTLMGMLPNNSDITVIVGSILVGFGKFEMIPFAVCVIALVIIGENISFLSGYFFGDKIKQSKLIQRIIPANLQLKLKEVVQTNPKKIMFSIRITPLLRPVIYFLFGSMGVSPKEFWKFHTPLVIIYLSALIIFTTSFSQFVQNNLSEYQNVIFLGFLSVWLIVFWSMKKNLKKSF